MKFVKSLAALAAWMALVGFVEAEVPPQPSRLVFFELVVTDLGRAQSFYGDLFGWTFSPSRSPDFIRIDGAGIPGGMLRGEGKQSGDGVKIFFAVDNVADCLERARKLGAKVVVNETRISPTRLLAEFLDPDGNAIGIIHDNPRE